MPVCERNIYCSTTKLAMQQNKPLFKSNIFYLPNAPPFHNHRCHFFPSTLTGKPQVEG